MPTSILDRLEPDDRARLEQQLVPRQVLEGEVLAREGECRKAMYFVLSGHARIRRGDFDLGVVGPGGHFGELGLIAERPRAASVTAETDMLVGMLDEVCFQRLLEDDPRLATKLVRLLVSALGKQLVEMTDSVGALLEERSLPRHTMLTVEVDGEQKTVRTGTVAEAVLPSSVAGVPVVAAHVDGKAVSLSSPLTANAVVHPVLASHWEGERVLRKSAALLLFEAAAQFEPDLTLDVGASLGPALWIDVSSKSSAETPPVEVAQRLNDAFSRLVAQNVQLRQEQWTVEEAMDHFREKGQLRAASLLSTERGPTVLLVTAGSQYALSFGPIVPRASYLSEARIVPDGHGVILLTGEGAHVPVRGGDYAGALEGHARWLKSLGVGSVGDFNRGCIDGGVRDAVRVAEGFHEKRIGRIADTIAERLGHVRLVCVAGPSSSGKTTFLKRLKVQLQVEGIVPVELSLDDYYVDRDDTPKDEHGQLDYEVLEALNLPRLRHDVARMLAGEQIVTPRYDFVTGMSSPLGGKTVTLGPQHLLLLEGIHGLNPALLGDAVLRDQVYRIFIQPMSSLPLDHISRLNPSDLRLIRRIVRDRHSRGTHADANIKRWPSVRAGEKKHIFPCIGEADVVFDTSLVYEPGVLKAYAERYLLEVPPTSEAHATAHRLRQLLDRFVTIRADYVPPTSILREFIGESGFEY